MKLGCTRATAVAAVNAVVKHLNLGLFMSELDMNDYGLQETILGKYVGVIRIVGLTNTGTWIESSISIVYPDIATNDRFPIQRVMVSIGYSSRAGASKGLIRFEYHLWSDEIGITRLESSPC